MSVDFRPAIRRALQWRCPTDFLKMLASSKKVASRKIPSGRSVKFPGIVNDAYALGTDRVTLWMALTGKRKSDKYTDLLAEYEKLKGGDK